MYGTGHQCLASCTFIGSQLFDQKVAVMRHTLAIVLSSVVTCIPAASNWGSNSTISNPILPGFHPDPSCIFVEEWDETFFCASSSFNAFPGIPIHASKDLQTWKMIGHVLNRPEQLPKLQETNRSTRYEVPEMGLKGSKKC